MDLGAARTKFEREGIRSGSAWRGWRELGGKSRDGSPVLVRDDRARRIAPVAFADSGGAFRKGVSKLDAERLRGWHWVHRMVQAGRDDAFARAQWDLVRLRSLDLAAVPLEAPFAARLDEVFTSEKAWALILFWHLRSAKDVVVSVKNKSRASKAIQDLVGPGGANLTAKPTTDEDQRKLIVALIAKAGGDLGEAMTRIAAWPAWSAVVPADNLRSFKLPDDVQERFADLAGASDVTPATATLDAGTVPPSVRSLLQGLCSDPEWGAAATVIKVNRSPSGGWRVTRAAPADHQAFWVVLINPTTLRIRMGLDPQHNSFKADATRLPVTAEGTGLKAASKVVPTGRVPAAPRPDLDPAQPRPWPRRRGRPARR